MTANVINFVVHFLSLSWLTGPIFDKELRVSSRRRRNYVLRFAYLALLTAFLVLVWVQEVQYSGSSVYLISRMARAGQTIIMFIVWFQFCATQVIAVVMLSTSISDEIYNRTLGLLMTTPINSFQIVMGKLFSKLLQLILLLAISMPLLAIVRVFGGVPWDYIISSLCITLTAVIFVGSVSLFFSIFNRRAYVVIIVTVLALSILFGLLLFVGMTIFGSFSWGRQASIPTTALIYLNPFMFLALSTDIMANPGLAGRVSFSWPVHCGVMLAASGAVLFACVGLVRKVALAQAAGYPNFLARLWRLRAADSVTDSVPYKPSGRIRRVKGPPVMWRELISRPSSRERLFVRTIIAIELIMIVAMYLFPIVAEIAGLEETHAVYIGVFMGLGVLSVTIFPATCITSEKEARSWPLLLTTTLSGWQILLGKFVGVLRRSLPIWALLFIYLIPFWGIGSLAFFQIAILVVGTSVFLCGTGFFFSSRFRRTSSAVATNFALAISVWGILPILTVLFAELLQPRSRRGLIDQCLNVIPFFLAMQVMWPDYDLDFSKSTKFVLAYILFGVLFAWIAKRRFRRNIF